MKPSHLLILLCLCTTSRAATVIPVVTASTSPFPTTITSGASVMNQETGYFTVIGGTVIVNFEAALLDFDVTLRLQSPTPVGLPAVNFRDYIGSTESVIDVAGFSLGDGGDYGYSPGVGFFGDVPPLSDGTVHNVVLTPGICSALAIVENGLSVDEAPGPVTLTPSIGGFASLSITVLNGDVVAGAVPEPGTWLLNRTRPVGSLCWCALSY